MIPQRIAEGEWYRMCVRALADPGMSPDFRDEIRTELAALERRILDPQRRRRTGRYQGIIRWVRYVGRPTRWGNPYKIGALMGERDAPLTRDEAVALFEVYARSRVRSEPGWLEPLRGYDLSCWCADDVRCHADVLIALLKEGNPS